MDGARNKKVLNSLIMCIVFSLFLFNITMAVNLADWPKKVYSSFLRNGQCTTGNALPSRSVTVRGAEMRLPKSSVKDTAVSDILVGKKWWQNLSKP